MCDNKARTSAPLALPWRVPEIIYRSYFVGFSNASRAWMGKTRRSHECTRQREESGNDAVGELAHARAERDQLKRRVRDLTAALEDTWHQAAAPAAASASAGGELPLAELARYASRTLCERFRTPR